MHSRLYPPFNRRSLLVVVLIVVGVGCIMAGVFML